jgi:uncharacterized membrane protein YgdD (TMEM256/DUF423 family)
VIADRLLSVLGCLFGAAGIVLMALAAHGRWPEINYAAVMVLAMAIRLELLRAVLARPAAFVLALAVALFSADVALHAITGDRLFSMAAPIGGTVSIIAWLMLAVSAAMARAN